MAELIARAERIEKNESVRINALWAFTDFLALPILVHLLGDHCAASY